MEYTRLPNSDLSVSRLCFGCEPLGGTDWGRVDEREVMAAVQKAVDLGLNFFDTADVYGLGRSERLLSQALGSKRHEVVIATKFGVGWREGGDGRRAETFFDASPRRVTEALEGSLRRLRLDCIPLYLVHWPDGNTPIPETMEALQRCREAGKIQAVGVSNFSAGQIREAHRALPLSVAQFPYNLIDRRAEGGQLPACRERGIAAVVFGPLAQGLLTGKYTPEARFGEDDRRRRLPHFQPERLRGHRKLLDRIKTVAAHHGRTPAQVSLRWLIENPAVYCVIAGAKSPGQVQENAGALGWRIGGAQYRYLAGESAGSSAQADR